MKPRLPSRSREAGAPGGTTGNRFPRELLVNLTMRQIRGTYKRSTLGFGWSMLNPLVSIAVYALVFRVVLQVEAPVGDPSGVHNYGLFLVAGILPWQYHVAGLVSQTASLAANRPLIEKVYFPRWTVPASSLAAVLFEFLIEMAVLLVIMAIFFHAGSLLWVPVLVVVITLQTAFLFGLGQILSIMNARFRDTEHLIRLVTQIWFWLTPIIYPISLVAARDKQILGIDLVTLYKLNPMVWFIDSYRALLYDVRGPTITMFAAMFGWAAGTLVVGRWYFRRNEARIAERL